jgi:hypothetical protein
LLCLSAMSCVLLKLGQGWAGGGVWSLSRIPWPLPAGSLAPCRQPQCWPRPTARCAS